MLGRPHINPSSIEVQRLSLRWTHPAGTTRPLLATALTTCCTGPLSALPLPDSLRHRARGANHRHSSKREPTRQACVTTAVVASPVTMRANGHKAPLFSRPLTTRCLCLEGRLKGTTRQVTSRCPRSPIVYMLATSSFLSPSRAMSVLTCQFLSDISRETPSLIRYAASLAQIVRQVCGHDLLHLRIVQYSVVSPRDLMDVQSSYGQFSPA